MSQRSRKQLKILIALLVITLLGLWGCSDSVLRPVESSPPDSGPPIIYDSGWIDALVGGTLAIDNSRDASACRLIVLPLAILNSTLISADLSEVHLLDSDYLEFEFQPDGLEFLLSAVLEIDVELFEDPELTHVDWYYFDPDEGEWSLQGQYEPVAGIIKIPVRHSSTYRGISQGGQVYDPQAK